MKCYTHPEVDASGTCVSCGRAICSECGVEVQEKLVCRDCLAAGKTGSQAPTDITDNDKMMGLLAYVIGIIVPLIILFSETGRQRPFQRFHAIQSLVLAGAILLVDLLLICPISVLVSVLTAGFGSICFLPIFLIQLVLAVYYGIRAYQGEYCTIPLITDLAHSAGWL